MHCRFWMNGSNPKRMYVMENVRDFVTLHNLQAGSTLAFYYAPDNRLVRFWRVASVYRLSDCFLHDADDLEKLVLLTSLLHIAVLASAHPSHT